MAAPSGTVSFLFTDIEGSTRQWEHDTNRMAGVLERHDELLRSAIAEHRGTVFGTAGDGFAAVFARVADALACAVHAQQSLVVSELPPVRMAVHTGEAVERDGDYFGPAVNRAARLMAIAHGGQVLCSAVSASLASELPADATLVDLGEHRLRDLSEAEHVFQLVAPGLRSEFPPVRSLDRYPGNLPIESTAFVGREAELEQVTGALVDSRIVTLCGVGGVGKTRLALQAAAAVAPSFGGGVWLVELAPVSSGDAFDEAVASALGVQQRPGATLRQTVLDYLRDKSLLLVLDNCEHLLDAAAEFVDAILRGAGSVRVLATSREGLALSGERIVTVPSMGLPMAEAAPTETLKSESVRLFVARAHEANSAFDPEADHAAVVAELCRRLDGIPLAIELAAARVSSMTPAEIGDHLDRRFKLLTRGRRSAATRHQTLRNTIDWSYDLLDEPERQVLRRLAVFAGNFGLDAAETALAGDDLDRFEIVDVVGRLVDKSLVVAEAHAGSTRYRLLETIRDYAFERLEAFDEVDQLAERHLAYFVAFATQAGDGLETSDELVWRDRIEDELENLRAAFRWSIVTENTDAALLLVYGFANVGSIPTSPLGTSAMEALELPGAAEHPLYTAALGTVCMTLTQQGDLERALAFADAAQDAANHLTDSAEHRKIRCRANACLTNAISLQDIDRLQALARREIEDARAIPDPFEILRALILLAGTLDSTDDDEAIAAGEESLVLTRELGIPSYYAWAPMILGGRIASRDPARAEQLLQEARAAAEAAGNQWAKSMTLQQLAFVQAVRQDVHGATRTLVAMATTAHDLGDHANVLAALAFLAGILMLMNDRDGSLAVGAWVEQRGLLQSRPSEAWGASSLGLTTYIAVRNALSEDERNRIAADTRDFDEMGMIEFVRARVEAT